MLAKVTQLDVENHQINISVPLPKRIHFQNKKWLSSVSRSQY
jgi:hypothetical protein